MVRLGCEADDVGVCGSGCQGGMAWWAMERCCFRPLPLCLLGSSCGEISGGALNLAMVLLGRRSRIDLTCLRALGCAGHAAPEDEREKESGKLMGHPRYFVHYAMRGRGCEGRVAS